MIRLKIILFSFLLMLAAGCATTPEPIPVMPVSYDAVFESVDLSGDSMITVDEFKTTFTEDSEPVFKEADADKDGQIYPDEWYVFREKKGYKN